jgi:hypothetical protein
MAVIFMFLRTQYRADKTVWFLITESQWQTAQKHHSYATNSSGQKIKLYDWIAADELRQSYPKINLLFEHMGCQAAVQIRLHTRYPEAVG